jgi:Fe2+ transport system protein B
MDDQPVMREPKQFTREIDDYFSSIADSFESSLAADQNQDFVGNLLIIFLISTVFSVLPIIPVIVWGAIRLWFSGRELFLSG